MNNQFDELPRELAQSATRRAVTKKFGVRLAGMALACFGLANRKGAGVNWSIPLLGIVLIGGSYAAVRSYQQFEQTIDAGLKFHATLDRAEEGWRLLRIQTQLQNGGGTESVPSLDGCLSDSVVMLKRDLASPDEQTRDVVQGFFEFMTRQQSRLSPMAASAPANPSGTELGPRQ